jgi:subtilisin family serine protease
MTTAVNYLLLSGLLSVLAGHASAADYFTVPSLETKQAIEQLTPPAGAVRPALKSAKDVNVKELRVNPAKGSSETQATNSQGQTSVPFVAANSMILQFQPDTPQVQVDDYIKSNKLKVVKTFPSIGAVQVETDLSRYFQPNISDNNANDAVARGFLEASKDFKKDPRIREATPDVILHSQADITNLMSATDTMAAATAKITDWGIQDIQADQLWNEPGAHDGVIVGIMDVGFAKHEDLVFIDFLADTPREDHGTHVSGIACGSHLTSVGVRGVIPNCFIRARYGDVFFQSAEGGQVTKFLALFSQILTTLTNFVDGYDDVSTFNISLGYNWISNFGINPDAPEASSWRAIVDIQGPFLVTLLQNAEKKGKIIFSAAGNDSTGLNPPINAKYASPFNWAALVARERNIKNGVIVEAHDQDGQRAPFSNVGGDISCPGVNILSTVAFDALHVKSTSAYGKMSGTSMASPYCAAGLTLFRLVRPAYSGEAALECAFKSSAKSSSGVPMLRLKEAIGSCQ